MDWSKLESIKEKLAEAYKKEDYVSAMSLINDVRNEITHHVRRITGNKEVDIEIGGHDSLENLTIKLGVPLAYVGRRVNADLEKFIDNCPINGYVYELEIYAEPFYDAQVYAVA
jgi:hypothetical protein